ncbi:MAG: hypothetical protein ACR2IE_15415 [Candidatus Sumerlaeaceae bacterium]
MSTHKVPKHGVPADPNEDRHIQYEPRTELGKRMLEWRRKIEASGEKLLTLEEVREEVRARRGGMD